MAALHIAVCVPTIYIYMGIRWPLPVLDSLLCNMSNAQLMCNTNRDPGTWSLVLLSGVLYMIKLGGMGSREQASVLLHPKGEAAEWMRSCSCWR